MPLPESFRYVSRMKLILENLPASLVAQRDTLARCLEAMDRALPLRVVYLFGSHARGEARPDSDVDLCLVAEGAERQYDTATTWLRAIWDVRPKPSFTLVPITPARLREKQAAGDFFFPGGLSGRSFDCRAKLTATIRRTGS